MSDCIGKIEFSVHNPEMNSKISAAYEEALVCLIERLTRKFDLEKWNSSGLMDSRFKFIVAGGAYPQPWQRDSGLITYDAANLLIPNESRNTLWSQVEFKNEKLIIKEGLFGGNDQYWDRICWALGAWNHFTVTNNTSFLEKAYDVVSNTLIDQRSRYFNNSYNLFLGGCVLDDNIDAYDDDVYDIWRGTAAIDYPAFNRIMSCNNNIVWYEGYNIANMMAIELNRPEEEFNGWMKYADDLKKAINKYFWSQELNRYSDYMLENGTIKYYQNDLAQAFAILFGIAERDQVESIIKSIHFEPQGIPHRWPHADFAFSDQKPSREGNVIWGIGQAAWAEAMSYAGRVDLLAKEINDMVRIRINTNGNFREIVDAITGEPEGGWESNGQKIEKSERDQGWTATGFLKMIHYCVIGMRFKPDGIIFAPCVPDGWDGVNLNKLNYRNMLLSINIIGKGNTISSFAIDGIEKTQHKISASLTGEHHVRIVLSESDAKTPIGARVINFSGRDYEEKIISGVYNGIDFGVNDWKTGGDQNREDWQRHICMNYSAIGKAARTFHLITKSVLLGFRAWTCMGTAIVKLESPGNQPVCYAINCDQSSYRTNWIVKTSVVTISMDYEFPADWLRLSSFTFSEA